MKYIFLVVLSLTLLYLYLNNESEISSSSNQTTTKIEPSNSRSNIPTPLRTKLDKSNSQNSATNHKDRLLEDEEEILTDDRKNNNKSDKSLVSSLPKRSAKNNLVNNNPQEDSSFIEDLPNEPKINNSDSEEKILDKNSSGGAPPQVISQAAVDDAPDTIDNEVFAKSELKRVSGQTRGFAMLYLMHPKARNTVEREVQILLDSQINDLYFSALVDGTFSFDADYLLSILNRLSTDNRTVTLALYFISGPTMRRFDDTPIRTFFSKKSPLDFRDLIQYDEETRNNLRTVVKRSLKFF